MLQIIGCLQDAPEEALAGIRMTFFGHGGYIVFQMVLGIVLKVSNKMALDIFQNFDDYNC